MRSNKRVRRKAKRIPGAPKQPLSPFMEFVKEERKTILQDLGKLSLQEMGKELGRRWRCLDASVKEIFKERSKVNRETYEKEMKEFASETERRKCDEIDKLEENVNDTDAIEAGVDTIKLVDLGFAKEKGYPWHPAVQSGINIKTQRIVVTFLGTAQRVNISKGAWLCYSEETLAKVLKSKSIKASVFDIGLKELICIRNKLLKGDAVSLSSVSLTPQLSSRRFRSLNKDRLQIEEEENIRLMEHKMYYVEETMFWMCIDCTWKGRAKHKAKAHARECGTRRKIKKRSCEKQFACSNGDCNSSFSSLKQLKEHYRYYQFSLLIIYNFEYGMQIH